MASTSAAEASSAMEEPPNWLEIPDEVMSNILKRLGTKEILNSAWKVCTTWRRICKDPAMWKAIDIKKMHYQCIFFGDKEIVSEDEVDLSRAESINIIIEGFGEKPLFNIVRRSQKQKHIAITRCYDVTGSELSQAVECRESASELKELHLFHISNINTKDIEAIGRNCPQLRSLSIISRWSLQGSYRLVVVNDDHALAIAKNMPELRHLGLFGSGITNNGLEAVLNGCPHLESLDVGECDGLDLNGSLGKTCMERIKDFKHGSVQIPGLIS